MSAMFPGLMRAAVLAVLVAVVIASPPVHSRPESSFLSRVRRSVLDTQADASRIIQAVLNGSAKHQAWNRLAEFTDTIGPRLSGTPAYDQGVAWLLQQMNAEGLDNVHGEDAQVPYWSRGQESVTLLSPRVQQLNVLGLGMTIGCSNLTAPVIVVASFDDLTKQAAAGNVAGKVVVFNQQCDWATMPTACYSITANYRVNGASAASRAGGVGCLVRSLAAFSINSPHTGIQYYDSDVKPVPVASITIEDAEMLQRMQDRGSPVVISMSLGAQFIGNVTQQNVIAEIKGSQWPEQVVLVSGHLDSWDVGHGAMDDGGGAFISWQALSLLRALGIQPLRTVRFVGWACEEFGGIGGAQYWQAHEDELPNMDLVMESDMGVFKAYGIKVSGSAGAQSAIQTIVQTLLQPINATQMIVGGGGEDIDPWQAAGVPGASLANYNDRYFWFHHSNGDTMSVLDPDDMDTAVITWAVTALAVANLDDMLPRNNATQLA